MTTSCVSRNADGQQLGYGRVYPDPCCRDYPSATPAVPLCKTLSPIDLPTRPWVSIQLPPLSKLRKALRSSKDLKPIVPPVEVTQLPEFDGDDKENPFKYPSDPAAFIESELKNKEKVRKICLCIPPSAKSTSAVQAKSDVQERVAAFSSDESNKPSERSGWKSVIREAKCALNVSKMQKISRNVNKAYMSHRRKLFYLDHAIHCRREGLAKLAKDASAQEKALQDFEWLVAFTQQAFDEFLKENDQDTFAAVQAAQTAVKERLARLGEAHNLCIQINTLKTDILSSNESLKECKTYMKFLQDIANELMRRDELDKSRIQRRAEQIKEEMVDYLKQGMTVAEAQEAIERNEVEAAGDSGAAAHFQETATGVIDVSSNLKMADEVSRRSTRSSASLVEVDDEGEDDACSGFNGEELINSLDLVAGTGATDRQELSNLSFTHPKQLLDIYQEMEEQNLSLMQHAQHSEQILEGIQQQIRKTKGAMDRKARTLRQEINKIEEENDKIEEKAQAIKAIISMFSGGNYDVKGQEKFMRLLQKHVGQVFRSAVKDSNAQNDSQLTVTLMLTAVEKQFEDLVRDIESMPAEVVIKISKEMDKDRRDTERLERMAERKLKSTMRASQAIERARAPIKYKRGRKCVPRSYPRKDVIELSQADLDTKAAEDEFNYFFGE